MYAYIAWQTESIGHCRTCTFFHLIRSEHFVIGHDAFALVSSWDKSWCQPVRLENECAMGGRVCPLNQDLVSVSVPRSRTPAPSARFPSQHAQIISADEAKQLSIAHPSLLCSLGNKSVSRQNRRGPRIHQSPATHPESLSSSAAAQNRAQSCTSGGEPCVSIVAISDNAHPTNHPICGIFTTLSS